MSNYDQTNLSEVAKLGFGYVKLYVSWNTIEPSEGNINSGLFPDNAVELAHANNLQVLVTIFDTPGWATCNGVYNNANPPPCSNHLAEFAQFMSALAAHYQGQVFAYEIWNEPNVNTTWGNQNPDVGTFVSMLQAAYAAIKANDPNALVVSGGLANTQNGNGSTAIGDITYLQQMLQMGAANDVDAIGTHPYPGACDPTASSCGQTPGTYFQRANEEHNAAVAAGFPNLPFWITEAGYFSQPGQLDPNAAGCNSGNGLGGFQNYEVNETSKANDLVAAYQYVYQNWKWLGMFTMMGLDLDQVSSYATCDPVRFWSILTSTGGETQAFTALANMPKTTPRISIAVPSGGYDQTHGTLTVNGTVSDPTTSGSLTVDQVTATIDSLTTPVTPLSLSMGPGNTFTAVFDLTHLNVSPQPHVFYLGIHTAADGWLSASTGLFVDPLINAAQTTVTVQVSPSQSSVQVVDQLGRNDGPGGCGFTYAKSVSWLSLSNNSDGTQMIATVTTSGLQPGANTTTITVSCPAFINGQPYFANWNTLNVLFTAVLGS